MNRKTILNKVATEMAHLYTNLKNKEIDRVDADSLANIAGKSLKAVQLDIADEFLLVEQRKRIRALAE